ncbi:hypothetical protein [Mucilaginibacter sp. PPCGB 2223]|uniref:hypothetical protein n=1 Tax=Mucilaginibacter sp. PPCGB 2223 TaxID=1886027 RepID=UPI001111F667|nr:hypothetical protein [Mucilaginibacter sp. PPCGB 2223]
MKFSFDFFNKNKKVAVQQTPVVQSILCIPGPWKDVDEFAESLIEANDGQYLYAAGFVMSLFPPKHYEMEIYGNDEQIKKSFEFAGRVNQLSKEFLEEIAKHNSVIYLKAETGAFEKALSIAKAGAAILRSGGIGVKVETTGKAFNKEHWMDLAENFQPGNLYRMFVLDTIIQPDGSVFTCGMHNLGLKDTVVSGEEFYDAMTLLAVFGFYQEIDLPTILDRQTFARDADSPKYRILEEPNQPYKDHDLYGNPFGMWRLRKE